MSKIIEALILRCRNQWRSRICQQLRKTKFIFDLEFSILLKPCYQLSHSSVLNHYLSVDCVCVCVSVGVSVSVSVFVECIKFDQKHKWTWFWFGWWIKKTIIEWHRSLNFNLFDSSGFNSFQSRTDEIEQTNKTQLICTFQFDLITTLHHCTHIKQKQK